MTLSQQIVAVAPRERSGSRTTGRYDYQTHWGVGLMVEIHAAGEDYAVVFEHHDDVVWLNHSSEPNRVRFYQVKTKQSGTWSLTDLTKKVTKTEGDEPRSIVAKMVSNCRAFADYADAAALVSNVGCADIPYDQPRLRFSEAGGTLFEDMTKKLKGELAELSEAEAQMLWFYRTDLSLGDTENHAKGVFGTFLREQFGDHVIASDSLYSAVFAECRRRAQSLKPIETFDDMLKFKAVTKATFQEWLAAATTAHLAPKWVDIQADIQWSAIETRAVRREWNSYHPQALDPGNEAVRAIRRVLREHIEQAPDQGLGLCPFVESLEPVVRPQLERLVGPLTQARLRAMLLWEYADQ